ncbi:YtxH domain-containing protein [Leucobacter luti]|uniref:YtxH domain-containing protein n=1 Tax=Leucobacter luti TaxID=340320 RepID=UPI00215DA9BB|nr:YtxH domain-containing protein [Leucobacter luti]
MKGKIAFVLGAAVGYVLGTRAGRERYEQIKRGAQSVWNTEPVQRGVGVVRTAAQGRVDELKATVVRAGKGAVSALMRESPAPAQAPTPPQQQAAEGVAAAAEGVVAAAEGLAAAVQDSAGTPRAASSKRASGAQRSSAGSDGTA